METLLTVIYWAIIVAACSAVGILLWGVQSLYKESQRDKDY